MTTTGWALVAGLLLAIGGDVHLWRENDRLRDKLSTSDAAARATEAGEARSTAQAEASGAAMVERWHRAEATLADRRRQQREQPAPLAEKPPAAESTAETI